MKELSIEEKAQKYDEAIERARYWEKNPTVWSSDDICQKLFPELREDSKDERIRKALIHHVNSNKELPFGIDNYDGIKWSDVLAWLEKQGKKPMDKVEPKFKVGDWIANNEGNVYKICREFPDEYLLIDPIGVEIVINKGLRGIYHKWTVQDAKDGDVLAYRGEQWIFIYKERKDETLIEYYALSSEKGLTINNVALTVLLSCVVPATKEQRDQLEKAMTDAGYTFDFERKRLKKIEQKPADKKGMNLKEEEMTPFQKKVFDIIDTAIEEEQGLKQVCDELLALASNEIEQNPTWSEEDDRMLDKCIKAACSNYYPGISSVREWLRGIKDRVLPQPNQEWSEKYIADVFEKVGLAKIAREQGYDALTKALQYAMIELSKFTPQPKQEWSKEDEDVINLILCICNDFVKSYEISPASTKVVKEDADKIKNWLKSLKDRYTWKPSDAQMKALEHFVRSIGESGYASPYDNNTKLVYSLLSELKKLKEE